MIRSARHTRSQQRNVFSTGRLDTRGRTASIMGRDKTPEKNNTPQIGDGHYQVAAVRFKPRYKQRVQGQQFRVDQGTHAPETKWKQAAYKLGRLAHSGPVRCHVFSLSSAGPPCKLLCGRIQAVHQMLCYRSRRQQMSGGCGVHGLPHEGSFRHLLSPTHQGQAQQRIAPCSWSQQCSTRRL